MKKYRILLHGEHFLFEHKRKMVEGGFVTTRFVEAKSQKDAETKAIKMVWKELGVSPDDSEEPATVSVDEIHEVESFGDHPVPGKGFTFYVSKNEKEEK